MSETTTAKRTQAIDGAAASAGDSKRRTAGRLEYDLSFNQMSGAAVIGAHTGNVQVRTDFARSDAAHLTACWNAVESIGGDAATVAELVAALEATSEQWHYAHPVDGRGRAAYLDCAHADCIKARAALARVRR